MQDLSHTRFSNEVLDSLHTVGFIKPSHNQRSAKIHNGRTTKEKRKDPFAANPDHKGNI